MDHRDIVARVKAGLEARGISLAGPCGAFEITKRVAWQLRAEGAGLLDKPGGNNCQGYSVDYVVYQDGRGADMLGDAGGANEPRWSEEVDPAFVSRWRPAMDPGDNGEPPHPSPTLEAVAAKVDVIAANLASLDRKLDVLATQSNANTEKVQQQIDQAVKNLEKSLAAALPALSAIIGKQQ
jgi:hypothetical protein